LENNSVKIWQKLEFTLKNNPATDYIEYFLKIDCIKKSSIIKSIIVHGRDGNIEKYNKPSEEVLITNPNSSLAGILQRHCRKHW
jgi:predicted ATP-dependent endonuclease of OLD family